jgi:predicted AlkP superfamily pyrophosphatase or phosphodiesterase
MRNSVRVRPAVTSLVGLFLSASWALSATQPSGPPGRPADYVFVIMLDGARPDALREANAPVIHRLAEKGAQYLQARTVYPSQTRVAFVSLPTGAYPEKHGIVGGDEIKDALWQAIPMGNDDPAAAQALVACPTFFEEATAAGLTSLYVAMKGYELVGARGATWTINGKQTLNGIAYGARYLSEVSGSSDLAAGYKQLLSRELLDQALDIVRTRRPNLVVINLGSADYAAHSFGPASARYRSAIEYLDPLVGDLLRVLDSLGIRDRSTLILSADHGFSEVDSSRVIAPVAAAGGHALPPLSRAGIEHFVVNTGGASMGIYVRDKERVAEAASLLRREPWCEAIYCEDGRAGCDLTLRGLRSYFAGRSPDLMVDLDDDAALNYAQPGQHGSLRDTDMRIPLILSGAGIAHGRVLGKASLVDVAPTVLRLLGIPPRLLRADGRVLDDALEAQAGHDQ